MAIVSDTSPIIVLSAIYKICLLNEVFGDVYIPEAVKMEIKRGDDKPGVKEIKKYKWFKIAKVKNKKYVRELMKFIGDGESEAIILSRELNLPLLCDDMQARRIVKKLGYIENCLGTCALLILAKKKGCIENVGNVLKELTNSNYRLGEKIIRETLYKAGEL